MVLSGQSLSVSAGHRTYDQAPETLEARVSGEVIYALIRELFPICRSITGDGIRRSLARIGELLPPLTLHEVASGTPVFDWEVPREWNIRDAYIKGPSGEKIVDFKASNLHVLNYSAPVHRTMTLEELRPHLHSLLEHPDWIPYLTSYRCLQEMPDDHRLRFSIRLDPPIPGPPGIDVPVRVCHPDLQGFLSASDAEGAGLCGQADL